MFLKHHNCCVDCSRLKRQQCVDSTWGLLNNDLHTRVIPENTTQSGLESALGAELQSVDVTHILHLRADADVDQLTHSIMIKPEIRIQIRIKNPACLPH